MDFTKNTLPWLIRNLEEKIKASDYETIDASTSEGKQRLKLLQSPGNLKILLGDASDVLQNRKQLCIIQWENLTTEQVNEFRNILQKMDVVSFSGASVTMPEHTAMLVERNHRDARYSTVSLIATPNYLRDIERCIAYKLVDLYSSDSIERCVNR